MALKPCFGLPANRKTIQIVAYKLKIGRLNGFETLLWSARQP
ncbi:hypothetical protein [Fibrobacter sp. UWR3]|nr:hypothetical protein [Fibrobacter sp. UWR3]